MLLEERVRYFYEATIVLCFFLEIEGTLRQSARLGKEKPRKCSKVEVERRRDKNVATNRERERFRTQK